MNRRDKIERKGLVLIAVLWMVILLLGLVATLGRNSMLDTKVSLLRVEQTRCKWACRAGIESAIAILTEDLLTEGTRESDWLTDVWSYNAEDFNDVQLEGCFYTVRVIDEAGKLNVNTASREQLMELPYITEDIVDAIIDWRDSDETPGTVGVEGGYYENLPYPYIIRNGSFKTIRELVLVCGVTEELLYGEDTNFNDVLDFNEKDGDASPPFDNGDDVLDTGWISFLTCYSYDTNTDAEGNEKVNINQADESELQEQLGLNASVARAIVEQRSNSEFESIVDLIDASGSDGSEAMDTATFYEIADMITVDSNSSEAEGKVNVNTAPWEVLVALLGGDERAEEMADNIVSYRAGLTEGMVSTVELLEVGAMDVETFRTVGNSLTTRSNIFTIYCIATADRGVDRGGVIQTEVVVDRESTPCEILYWYQGESY